MVKSSTSVDRVAVYVDGYNVYYGLEKGKGWRHLLWLDFRSLFEREMRPNQELVAVNYFTALGRRQSDASTKRQNIYLAALEASGGVDVHRSGRFENRRWKCSECGHSHKRPQEKMTDVALAVRLVADAHAGVFDTAWLMSADADFVPAVEYLSTTFPEKTIVTLPPRGRRSNHLIRASHAKRDISKARHSKAQLPDEVVAGDGTVLRRPEEWS